MHPSLLPVFLSVSALPWLASLPSAAPSSPPSTGKSTLPSAAHPSPPSTGKSTLPSAAHPSPPTAADSSLEYGPTDPVHTSQPGVPFHVPWRHGFSLFVPTGTVLIHPVLSVMSMETHRGQAAPLAMVTESPASPVAEMETVAERSCEGPWCHAQNGPQHPSLAQGGFLVPVLAREGSWYPLYCPINLFGKGSRASAAVATRPRPQWPPTMVSRAPNSPKLIA